VMLAFALLCWRIASYQQTAAQKRNNLRETRGGGAVMKGSGSVMFALVLLLAVGDAAAAEWSAEVSGGEDPNERGVLVGATNRTTVTLTVAGHCVVDLFIYMPLASGPIASATAGSGTRPVTFRCMRGGDDCHVAVAVSNPPASLFARGKSGTFPCIVSF
jgi:hypothetical protein